LFEAQKQLAAGGKKTAQIHFTYLYPLDREKVTGLFKSGKRYVLVENNSTGQFGKLLLQETGIEIKEKILRYDGRVINTEQIIKAITG
jgi:2-oxoglutarate ferredoxin oxidoreductase subunit alpha